MFSCNTALAVVYVCIYNGYGRLFPSEKIASKATGKSPFRPAIDKDKKNDVFPIKIGAQNKSIFALAAVAEVGVLFNFYRLWKKLIDVESADISH